MTEVTPRFKVDRIRSEAHLEYVRRLPCSVTACRVTPCSPHHVRTAATAGTSVKPGDDCCAPLCHDHHMELHQKGQSWFRDRYRVDLGEVARAVAGLSRAMWILPQERQSDGRDYEWLLSREEENP